MAGIGDRMNAGSITFRNGVPIDMPGDPLPDDETLERLRKQNEEWARAVPQTVGAEPRPLTWRRGGAEEGGGAEEEGAP